MAICVHEAGHAMACFLYKIPVKEITVVPDEAYLGKVSPLVVRAQERLGFERRERRQRALAERIIRCCLAGAIAQKKYSKASFRKHHATKDREIALDMAIRISGSVEEALALCQLLGIQIKQELQLPHNWRPIMALARQMKKHRTLSGRKARALLKVAQQRVLTDGDAGNPTIEELLVPQ